MSPFSRTLLQLESKDCFINDYNTGHNDFPPRCLLEAEGQKCTGMAKATEERSKFSVSGGGADPGGNEDPKEE